MTKLSVNVNKIATLRNSRGEDVPNVVDAVIKCQQFGAKSITVHPRPDERHITRVDVFDIKNVITNEYNIEGYPSEEFLSLVCSVKPTQVTLVPDSPDVLTSNQGWDIKKYKSFLTEIIFTLQKKNIRTSIFVDTDLETIELAKKTGVDRIELYTKPYADFFPKNPEKAVQPFVTAAELANQLELGINAGHDLNMQNLKYFKNRVSGLLEVSIGHALIADAIYLGLKKTIHKYLKQLK